MSQFFFYIALIFLLYQVAKRIRRALMPPPQQRMRRSEPGRVPDSRPAPPAPQADIDYSKIRDADYRDIR